VTEPNPPPSERHHSCGNVLGLLGRQCSRTFVGIFVDRLGPLLEGKIRADHDSGSRTRKRAMQPPDGCSEPTAGCDVCHVAVLVCKRSAQKGVSGRGAPKLTEKTLPDVAKTPLIFPIRPRAEDIRCLIGRAKTGLEIPMRRGSLSPRDPELSRPG
jgi:hypothetical protein